LFLFSVLLNYPFASHHHSPMDSSSGFMHGDVDDIHFPPIRDTRLGVRRGHCKRLRADKGRESARGRASFARSVSMRGRCLDLEFVDYDLEDRSRVRLQQAKEEIVFWSLATEDGVENALWSDTSSLKGEVHDKPSPDLFVDLEFPNALSRSVNRVAGIPFQLQRGPPPWCPSRKLSSEVVWKPASR